MEHQLVQDVIFKNGVITTVIVEWCGTEKVRFHFIVAI